MKRLIALPALILAASPLANASTNFDCNLKITEYVPVITLTFKGPAGSIDSQKDIPAEYETSRKIVNPTLFDGDFSKLSSSQESQSDQVTMTGTRRYRKKVIVERKVSILGCTEIPGYAPSPDNCSLNIDAKDGKKPFPLYWYFENSADVTLTGSRVSATVVASMDHGDLKIGLDAGMHFLKMKPEISIIAPRGSASLFARTTDAKIRGAVSLSNSLEGDSERQDLMHELELSCTPQPAAAAPAPADAPAAPAETPKQ